MEGICELCQQEFGDRPRIELVCHHIFHTQCFFNHMGTIIHDELHIRNTQCPTCHQLVFEREQTQPQPQTQEPILEQTPPQPRARPIHPIVQRYDTDVNFRNDVKKYVTALRGRAKPRAAFRKYCSTKKTELAPRYKQLKEHIQALYNVKKREITSSDEYKEYRKSEAKANRYKWYLAKQYEIDPRHLKKLDRKPGCSALSRRFYYRDTPGGIIRRALRLRIPWR